MDYPIPRRLINPYREVPDDRFQVFTFLSKRPGTGGLGRFSKIALPGPHLILPGSVLTGEYAINQFTSYLFRHEGPRSVPLEQRTHEQSNDDIDTLELDDVTLFARGSILAQIKGRTLEEQAKNVYKVHYKAQAQDEREATEVILNVYIREVLQRYVYQNYRAPKGGIVDVNKIQISKITSDELLHALGLKRVGFRIEWDENNTEFGEIGRAIQAQLDEIGIEILQINVSINLSDEVNAAKDQILTSKLRQQAALEDEIGRGAVIAQANANKVLEAEGLLKAAEALMQGSTIPKETAIKILFEWPAIKEALENNSTIITEGGLSGLLGRLQSVKHQ